MASTQVEGFNLEVTVEDGVTRIRMSHSKGDEVLETKALSVQGMRRMGRVFGVAANLAIPELEAYYRRLEQAAQSIGRDANRKALP